MIKTSNISLSYKNGINTQKILENVTMEIKDGEFVIITGPSGSGKTTLLNILSGHLKPNSGKVYWDDTPIYDLKENILSNKLLKESGFVYQDFMLIDELNVFDNLILPKRLIKDKNDDAVYKIIEELELQNLLTKKPIVLSGGEKQKVAIARSLVNNPKVLFCDEPTGSLDYNATHDVMELLKYLNEKFKITIVLVTHEQDNLKYATRIIKFYSDKLLCD